jgi:undecaprenyl diphosphate synthase
MIYRIYERLLEKQVAAQNVPKSIAIVISVGDLNGAGLETVGHLINWSEMIGVVQIALYIDEDSQEIRERIEQELSEMNARISLHTEDGVLNFGQGGEVALLISLGYGGKREVAAAIKKLLKDVDSGLLDPDQIDEKMIENNLRFSQRPDLVIRAGGKLLSDFMIWQAAYSELYFTDVNWIDFRKIDFLRAIRDFQRRARRFGR